MFKWAIVILDDVYYISVHGETRLKEIFNNQVYDSRARARYYKKRYKLGKNCRVMKIQVSTLR